MSNVDNQIKSDKLFFLMIKVNAYITIITLFLTTLTSVFADQNTKAEDSFKKGYVMEELNRNKEAIDAYSKAIKLQPEFYDAYYHRGKVYKKMKKYSLAIQDFTRLIEASPKSEGAYLERCDAYSGNEDYQHAIDDCTRAIEINPQSGTAYGYRGAVYLNLGNYDQAIKDMSRSSFIPQSGPGLFPTFFCAKL